MSAESLPGDLRAAADLTLDQEGRDIGFYVALVEECTDVRAVTADRLDRNAAVVGAWWDALCARGML